MARVTSGSGAEKGLECVHHSVRVGVAAGGARSHVVGDFRIGYGAQVAERGGVAGGNELGGEDAVAVGGAADECRAGGGGSGGAWRGGRRWRGCCGLDSAEKCAP